MTRDPKPQISEELLHGYADGLLSEADRRRVKAYLDAHPDKAAQVADWTRQNAAIDALFPQSEAERHAQALTLPSRGPARRAPWPQAMRLAAMLALVAVGLAGGWLARGGFESRATALSVNLVREAINAHAIFTAEVLHPVEVTAADESHLVGWLSKRLGTRIVAPDLTASGYQLIGGRLLPADAGPAAQFMYENAAGRRITVYATGGSPGTLASFQFDRENGISGIYWQDQRLRYAVVGKLSRDQLTALATEVYRQLI